MKIVKREKGFTATNFDKLSKCLNEEEIKNFEYLELDEKTIKDLKEHKIMWSNKELVENPNYQEYKNKFDEINLKIKKREAKNSLYNQIATLKKQLSDSDYRAIKYFEGYYTEEEYAQYKAQRQEWRDEINRLEEELKSNQ